MLKPRWVIDKTYATTLPGCCLRLWCSIVADEDLETDNIDVVKAFTQASVDRELYVPSSHQQFRPHQSLKCSPQFSASRMLSRSRTRFVTSHYLCRGYMAA